MLQKLATSHCTNNSSVRSIVCLVQISTHTAECTVTACRTFLKVRKGGDFFYGKSSYENYTKGVRPPTA